MNEIYVALTVAGLFLIRIAIPFTLLILLGTLIERHQLRERERMMQFMGTDNR